MARLLFAEWQPRYAEAGIALFPVRNKVPAIKNYLRLRVRGSRTLVERFADSSAFGFALEPSGIVVVDVDTPSETVLADALALYGDTPFIVRSGGGNYQAWYRRTNEGRHIRPDPDVPIDILGGGFVVAPPSLGEKGRYQIIRGALPDLSSLPRLNSTPSFASVRTSTFNSGKAAVDVGRRNTALWRHCMGQAIHCDDFDDLLDVARTLNADLVSPLGDAEVIKTAGSAWDYTERGQNRFGSQHVRIAFEIVDELFAINPDAYLLFTLLLRQHSDASHFFVANGMAASMPPDGWSLKRFRSARSALLDRGLIACVRSPSSVYGAALYGWGQKRC